MDVDPGYLLDLLSPTYICDTWFLLQGFCVPYLDGVKGDPGPPGPRVRSKNIYFLIIHIPFCVAVTF